MTAFIYCLRAPIYLRMFFMDAWQWLVVSYFAGAVSTQGGWLSPKAMPLRRRLIWNLIDFMIGRPHLLPKVIYIIVTTLCKIMAFMIYQIKFILSIL